MSWNSSMSCWRIEFKAAWNGIFAERTWRCTNDSHRLVQVQCFTTGWLLHVSALISGARVLQMLTAGASLRPVFLLVLLEIGRYFFGKVTKFKFLIARCFQYVMINWVVKLLKFKSPGFFWFVITTVVHCRLVAVWTKFKSWRKM